MERTRTVGVLGGCVLLLASAAPPALKAEQSKPTETFSCFAVAVGTGRADVIEITINRWSTDAERDMLLTTLQEFGQEKLLAALEKIRPPVGYMRIPNSIGYDLYYARNHSEPDGGRKVVLATNRQVSFREVTDNVRSLQYQFTLIELHLDKQGKGEGKLVPAAKVSWDTKEKKIEIENYNALPVELVNVTAKKP